MQKNHVLFSYFLNIKLSVQPHQYNFHTKYSTIESRTKIVSHVDEIRVLCCLKKWVFCQPMPIKTLNYDIHVETCW